MSDLSETQDYLLDEIARLTQALAEARREVEEQARLRRVAEDAIPRGIEVAKEFIRAEYERRLALAERVVEAARGLSARLSEVHDDPRYRAVWEVAQLHLGMYRGLTYTEHHAALRARLAEWEGK